MHYFRYKNNRLYCESVRVEDIAKKVGTPFYLYSYRTIVEHYSKIRGAFSKIRPLICFSMKSNSNLAVCRALVKAGAGLDIVSGGELYKALRVKVDPKKVVYAGVGKTAKEIDNAITAGILFFNIESIPELELIESRCARLNRRVRISIRVNPGVDAHTHHYITTGRKLNKFGINRGAVTTIFDQRHKYPHLDIIGLHVHIGSQITIREPFVKAVERVSSLVVHLRRRGHNVE